MEDTMTVAQPTEDTLTADQAPDPAPTTAPPQEDTPAEAEAPSIDYAALEAADIDALRHEFPELLSLRSLTELQQPARYGALRDLGLSPKEAYLATETRRAQLPDNRSHLRSAIPHAVGGSGESISAAELAAARELFLGLSDHEIRKLYKKVTA
ncbi:MAG: hypothetical protein IJW83_02615 [Clostridia bacterium]|nr:hypothetical protein [Clostridia bacterium]